MNPDELLDYYLGPTGIPDRLRLVNEFLNPIVAIRDAQRQAIRAANPDLDPRERLAAGASSALTTGLMGIPALMANRGYMPSAEALGEILTGIGASSPTVQAGVQEAIARFNQPGPMPTLYSNPIPGLGDNTTADDLFGLGSRTLRAVQELPQQRGTYQQLRQALIKSAGGEPAEREIFFTGMDQMFDPQQQVTRQELEDYLARTTPMFRTTEDRASGVIGETANRYDLLEAAERVYPNTDAGRARYDELVQEYADRYGLNPHDNATVMEALEEEYADRMRSDLFYMDDDELAAVVGVSPGFDPRETQYSDYFTPGLSDYRERRYGFTNPGAIGADPQYPERGYSSASSHFDRDEFTPFLHTRTATASAMGGRDNAYHIGELQSDFGQAIQQGRINRVPETPEMVPYMRLARLQEMPPAQWRQVMREGMPGREDWYESTFRLPGWEGSDPGQGEFLVAADNVLSRARQNLDLAEMYARDEVTALSQPVDLYRDRLREYLPAVDDLGFDSPGSAVAALIGDLRAGRSPEEIAGNWGIPEDTPIMSLIRNASDRGVFNGEAATNLNAARERLYDIQSQRRNLGSGNAASIRPLIDTDIDPRFEERLNAGEFFSDQEIYQIMRETSPRQANAIFAQQEFMRRGINPTVVRDLTGMNAALEAGTRSAQPFVESTNQWVDFALRQELFNAAVEGRPYVTLSNPEMVRRMTMGSEHGQGEFYGSIVPNRLRHLLRRLDRNAQITSSPDEFRSNPEMILGPGFVETDTGREEVLTLRMTPELRARILGDEEQGYRGLTTFLRPETAVLGGALASGAFMGQDEGPQ